MSPIVYSALPVYVELRKFVSNNNNKDEDFLQHRQKIIDRLRFNVAVLRQSENICTPHRDGKLSRQKKNMYLRV